jgi:alkanesulfonate monooxygenase SsuD/methylene tetrahydromethanopterin reductase-like flavin-dependent oxidoreductase (luciferase family)
LKIGITLPQAGPIASKDNVIRMAHMAEDEGVDSLWVFERLLWPINPQTPYPGTPDGRLPAEYQIMLDPLQTLAFVSSNTNKILLGTCIIDMLFHNPVLLSKSFATLDIFSNGRTVAGFGIGWSKDEYQSSNIPFNDNVEFKGQYYNIPSSKIGPKPLQKPHIPIYLGGFSPNTFSRIVNYDTNGWLGALGGSIEQIKNIMNTIRENAKKTNKDPNNFRVILLTYPNVIESHEQNSSSNNNSNSGSNRFPMNGTIDQIGKDIKEIKDIGVDHIIFGYNISSIGKDIDKMIDVTKQFSKFAK